MRIYAAYMTYVRYHARSVREGVATRLASLRAQHPRFTPTLAIFQAGARPDSSTYVRMKARAAADAGIAFRHVTLPEEATAAEVTAVVRKLNEDGDVHGVLVQLPLGPAVNPDGERAVTEAISPGKDVDGCVESCAYTAETRIES